MHTHSILTNREAAAYLRISWRTLNNSRVSGTLLSVRAPQYQKIGKSIRYKKESLDDWLAQFCCQHSTSD